MKIIEGVIELIRCSDCNNLLPDFTFYGENDTVYMGWKSGFIANTLDLEIVEFESFEEWKSVASGKKIGFENQGKQFLTTFVSRIEDGPRTEMDFFKSVRERIPLQKSTIFYSCPYCGSLDAKVEEKCTRNQFKDKGGKVFIPEGCVFRDYSVNYER